VTPAARAATAIEILDRIAAGAPAERALINWARASRHAGSGDRAAVRDLVFDVLRRRRSSAALGGGEDGRALVLGLLRGRGVAPEALFTGGPHAPAPLTAAERAGPPAELSELEALDCPDWLAPALRASLGADFAPVMAALRDRAPVVLRVNRLRATPAAAAAALDAEGIATRPHPLAATALEVTENARRVQSSRAYAEGLVELQDAASQAVAEAVPLRPGARVLDYCAGGGGKALALAARDGARVTAHDANPARMRDLPARAARAGARIAVAAPGRLPRAAFDVVLADAPCSGSGSWRRAPEAKWALDAAALAALVALQDRVLDAAAAHVAPGGVLAYATCSLLDDENGARVAAFRARLPGWVEERRLRLTPLDGGDGFFLSVLRRTPGG
jgi:16S rRNA (cytosine967-C5)-methyltransferase